MNFKPESIEKSRTGEKTETHRPKKEGQHLEYRLINGSICAVVVSAKGRVLHYTNQECAMCPGRGKRATDRMIITGIHEERLGAIDDAAAQRAGFKDRLDYLVYWRDNLYKGKRLDEDQPVFVYKYRYLESC